METFKYQVQQGDNPASIADQFKLQPQDLFQSNQNAFPLDVGQTITIPGPLTRPNIGSRLASPRGPYGGGIPIGTWFNFRPIGQAYDTTRRAFGQAISGARPVLRGMAQDVQGFYSNPQAMPRVNAQRPTFGVVGNKMYGPPGPLASGSPTSSTSGADSSAIVRTSGNRVNPVTGFSNATGNSSFQFPVLDAQGNDTGRRIGAISTQSDLRNIAASQGMSEAQFASQNGYVKFGGSYVLVSSEVGGGQDSGGDGNYRGGSFANRFFQVFGERSGAHIAGRGGGGRGRGKGGGGGGGGNKPKEEEQDKSQVDNITQRASTG